MVGLEFKRIFKGHLFIGLVILVLLAVLGFSLGLIYSNFKTLEDDPQPKESSTPSTNLGKKSPSSEVNKKTLEKKPLSEKEIGIVKEMIGSSNMLDKIPQDHPITLQFYYFEGGRRVSLRKFILGPGGKVDGQESDLKILLDRNYISDFETDSFCDVIKAAKSAGHLGTRSELSSTKLLWRYKSLMEYKDCFGL